MKSKILTLVIPVLAVFLFVAYKIANENESESRFYTGPIIDMHVHAEEISSNDRPMAFCYPASTMIPYYDPKNDWFDVLGEHMSKPKCGDAIWSPSTTDELLQRTLDQFEKYNILPVLGGAPGAVRKWKSSIPRDVIQSLGLQHGRDTLSPQGIRYLVRQDGFQMIGEVANQYVGIGPAAPEMDNYYSIAEELDIPIAIHMGSGSPGAPLGLSPDYSVAHSNPLLLESVLKKYPKLRVSIMHYGEPFIDELIAMMYHYPQIYIDLGGIQWTYPSDYFNEYHLKKIVSAGFGKRIMFGSDAMIWPELIGKSIDIINAADFLTYEEKADIFYNNAARFLRLD